VLKRRRAQMAMLFPVVMPGLDPGIHQTRKHFSKTMDGRVKPGYDDGVCSGVPN
jgi:hypothetical protein